MRTGHQTRLPMLIIALIVISAVDRMTLERNHRPQTVVKMG